MKGHFFLQRAFIVDFLTCMPWYAVLKLFSPKHNENHTVEDHKINDHMYHCILRMVNVLQIYKLYAAFCTESIEALKRVNKFNSSYCNYNLSRSL